ncbi:MAG: hypothetical protein Roseis2KO_25510 [Roseivirga sp.]
MKLDIDQIKLETFGPQAQITFFKPDGTLVTTCHSILQIDPETPVYDQFVFLQSLQEVFQVMEPTDIYEFPIVEWDEGAKGLFHLTFLGIANEEHGNLIQWTLEDNTRQYQQMVELQQGRNDNAISEEFALIQKKVAEIEKQLVEFQNEELKRIQDFKTDFFAQVSHEMRTPLNSISGLVSLLMDNEAKSGEYLPALQATSKHLNSIINDILDISKIDAGKLSFESLDFDLSESIRAIIKGFEYEAGNKGVSLNLTLPPEPFVVKSDPIRVAQVLYNLLGNSLKFTEKGYVSLEISNVKESESHFSLEFRVEDTGIGMDPSRIETLLEPYSQAEEKTSRLYGGTGLGLHIALKLIEAMGSQLEIRSALNKGTRMYFTLVLEKGKLALSSKKLEAAKKDLSQYSILVAEDDLVNQKILTELLKGMNARNFEMLPDGQALFDSMEQGDYDLIITDINLPGKTGLEVFFEMRALGKKLPFLFISGSNLAKRTEMKDYENWAFVHKPVDMVEVMVKIGELLPKKYNTALNLSSLKEMISGDMAFFRDLVQTILDTLPAEVIRLDEALGDNDDVMVTKVLHKIRPSIDYLGIPELSRERHWLHSQAEAGKIDDDYNSRVSEFKAWVQQVLVKLEKEL